MEPYNMYNYNYLPHGSEVLKYINNATQHSPMFIHNRELNELYKLITNNLKRQIYNSVENNTPQTEVKFPVDTVVSLFIRPYKFSEYLCIVFQPYVKQLNLRLKEDGYKIIFDEKYYIVSLDYVGSLIISSEQVVKNDEQVVKNDEQVVKNDEEDIKSVPIAKVIKEIKCIIV
jgi:hypothetical protein